MNKNSLFLTLAICLGVFASFAVGCGSGPSTGDDVEAQRTMADTITADTMAGTETGAVSASADASSP
jgi:hypothetical protein